MEVQDLDPLLVRILKMGGPGGGPGPPGLSTTKCRPGGLGPPPGPPHFENADKEGPGPGPPWKPALTIAHGVASSAYLVMILELFAK